jgi:prophage maintenance system killer protein
VRYLKGEYVFSLWEVLRTIAQDSGEDPQSFEPLKSIDDMMTRLDAATARPKHEYDWHEAHPSFFEKVAALAHGIAGGHCFGNGNKRTALLSMLQMMHINGWEWDAPGGHRGVRYA